MNRPASGRDHVLTALSDITQQPEVNPDTDLDDLGLDSLDRVRLAVALEHRTGHAIPDQVILTARTPTELAALIDRSTR